MVLRSRYPARDRSWRFSMAVGASAIQVLALSSGCIASSGDGEPPCLPPAFSVNPSSAKPGETVTVQAPDTDCNPRYGENALVRVTVTDASGTKVVNTTGPMNDAGGFTYSFVVPAQAATGDAAVEAMPHNIDWCDDTGRNNRVPAVRATMQRVSCAARIMPLTIAP